jgi:hypothetical protein
MFKNQLFFVSILFITLFSACVKDTIVKKEEEIIPSIIKSQIEVNFRALVNGKDLVPKTKWYNNSSDEVYTVTKFNYYISNIKLIDVNGKMFVEPESYHLIQHTDGINKLTIKEVPEGTYTKIEFLIGVDSARNVSGAQKGALDPANVMFWEWKTGYIFFKLEGSYASATTNEMEYAIHAGGFKGKFSCLQTFSSNINTPIVVAENKISKVYFNTILDETFKNPTKIGFDLYYQTISDSTFNLISKNYKNMFVIDRVEN